MKKQVKIRKLFKIQVGEDSVSPHLFCPFFVEFEFLNEQRFDE